MVHQVISAVSRNSQQLIRATRGKEGRLLATVFGKTTSGMYGPGGGGDKSGTIRAQVKVQAGTSRRSDGTIGTVFSGSTNVLTRSFQHHGLMCPQGWNTTGSLTQTYDSRRLHTYADKSIDDEELANILQGSGPERDQEAPGDIQKVRLQLRERARDFCEEETPRNKAYMNSVAFFLASSSELMKSVFEKTPEHDVVSPSLLPLFTTTTIHGMWKRRRQVCEMVEANNSFKNDLDKMRREVSDEKFSEELFDYYLNYKDELSVDNKEFILNELWNLGKYDLCVVMIENSNDAVFNSKPEVMVRYVQANLKSNLTNFTNVKCVINLLLERGEDGPEVQAALGVYHAIRMNSITNLLDAYKQDLPENEKQNLISKRIEEFRVSFPEYEGVPDDSTLKEIRRESNLLSMEHYRKAWSFECDPRYGVRVVHRLIEAGDYEKAKKMADQVQLACVGEGVGVTSQNNLALIRTMLEVRMLTGSKGSMGTELTPEMLFNKLLLCCDTPPKTTHALISLKNFAKFFPDNTKLKTMVKDLETHQVKLLKEAKKAVMKDIRKRKITSCSETTTLLEEYGTTYRPYGTYNFWQGNTQFGCQLTQHCVQKCDRDFFTEMASIPLKELPVDLSRIDDPEKTLFDIEDPEEISRIADEIIRFAFDTDNGLEQLDSEGHRIYDRRVLAMFEFIGAGSPEARKELRDSHTNIAFSLMTGLGDCRHHAQAKQLLFDMWQAGKVDAWIREMVEIDRKGSDVSEEDRTKRAGLVGNIRKNLQTQMRVFHTEVHAPISLNTEGNPEWEGDHLVLGEEGKIEEHTLTMLVKFDPKGNIVGMKTADSFYHHTYPFQNAEVSDIDAFSRGDAVDVAEIDVVNPETGGIVKQTVKLAPTPWSRGINTELKVYKKGVTASAVFGVPYDKSILNPWLLVKSVGEARRTHKRVEEEMFPKEN